MSKRTIQAWRATGVSLSVALLLSLLGWVSLSQGAFAASDQPLNAEASITVNTNSPAINDDGLCSIVEALENANADAQIHDDCAGGSGADIIALPNDAVLLFTAAHNSTGGDNALPVITGTITILGNGAALVRDINVAPAFRFFRVEAEGNLTLYDLGMRYGRAGLGGTTQLLFGGGAIVNEGTLAVVDSNLSFNSASFGGAIYSQSISGTLTVENSTFTSNQADYNGGAIYNANPADLSGGILRYNGAGNSGGAILHDSSAMLITGTTVQDNVAAETGAGISSRATVTDSRLEIHATNVISNVAGTHGGGIYNSASNGLASTVEIVGSVVVANRADSTDAGEGIGGGIVNGWPQGDNVGLATLRVSRSSITDNVAQLGGGIANVDAMGLISRTAHIEILQSTLAANTAVGLGSDRGTGGGLYNSNGSATVANSTLSGNQAVGDDETLGGRGGGIGSVGRGMTTTLQLLNSTIAFNEATQAGGGIALMGQVTTTPTSMDVGNTLIVSNELSVTQSVSNAVALATIAAPQVITGTESCSIESGSANSLGGNIEDGNTCQLNTVDDLQNTSEALEPLANNGGPTETHLITAAGKAYNKGVNALCEASPVNGVDQRGITRPQGPRCDVGAVEIAFVGRDEMFFPQMYRFHSFQ